MKALALFILAGTLLCLYACTNKGAEIYKPLTQTEYNTLINGDKMVFIDFSASWCNPCKMLAPVLGELAVDKDIKDKISIIRLDSKVHEAIFSNENIEAFPTMVLYKKGQVIWRTEGYMPKDVLKAELLARLKN